MSEHMPLANILNSTSDKYRIARLFAQKSRELGLDETYFEWGPADAYEQLQYALPIEDPLPRVHMDLLISLLQCKRAMDDVEFRAQSIFATAALSSWSLCFLRSQRSDANEVISPARQLIS